MGRSILNKQWSYTLGAALAALAGTAHNDFSARAIAPAVVPALLAGVLTYQAYKETPVNPAFSLENVLSNVLPLALQSALNGGPQPAPAAMPSAADTKPAAQPAPAQLPDPEAAP